MKKIMFNDKYGLTKAVLEGRKTMTRRVVRHPEQVEINGHKYLQTEKCRFKVGEVVAVAQSYKDAGFPASYIIDEFFPNIQELYGWTNKMFVRADLMPNQIRITNIRVERLQDISNEDCKREGIDYIGGYSESYYFGHGVGNVKLGNSYRQSFASLIDKVSGKGTWQSNPWVFVYEFELVQ